MALLDAIGSVRYLLKPEDISIDNWVFRLHYRATVLVLLTSSGIGVAKQYFGEPINCQTASGVSSKVMDDYCWVHSTFHVRSEFQGNVGCILDLDLTAPFSSSQGRQRSLQQHLLYDTPDTAFYQWVPFTLVFQAVMFYLPRKLWKSFEGGLMESFGKDAKKSVLLSEDCPVDVEVVLYKEVVAKKYANFFLSTLHHNNGYFLQYFFCEALNLVIDIGNIYFTDVFLNGRFLRYGSQVLKFYSHTQVTRQDMPNPMCTVFPTVTSCTFHSVGTAAGEQKFNSLCILSLNIINEKIFLLLWFWFFGLTFVSACHLVFRVLTVATPFARISLLLLRARMFAGMDRKTVRRVLAKCYLGDWWVLYQLGRNSNTHFFRYLLRYLDESMNCKQRSGVRGKRRVRYAVERVEGVEEEEEEEEEGSEDDPPAGESMRRRKGTSWDPKIAMPYTV